MMREITRYEYTYPISEGDYDANYYYAGSFSGTDYGYTHVQQIRHVGYIHLYIIAWSRKVLAELVKDFDELKHRISDSGIRLLIGTYPIDGTEGKWIVFTRIIGFRDPVRAVMGDTDCLLVCMEVGNGD